MQIDWSIVDPSQALKLDNYNKVEHYGKTTALNLVINNIKLEKEV